MNGFNFLSGLNFFGFFGAGRHFYQNVAGLYLLRLLKQIRVVVIKFIALFLGDCDFLAHVGIEQLVYGQAALNLVSNFFFGNTHPFQRFFISCFIRKALFNRLNLLVDGLIVDFYFFLLALLIQNFSFNQVFQNPMFNGCQICIAQRPASLRGLFLKHRQLAFILALGNGFAIDGSSLFTGRGCFIC